jgi:hypothetical protein
VGQHELAERLEQPNQNALIDIFGEPYARVVAGHGNQSRSERKGRVQVHKGDRSNEQENHPTCCTAYLHELFDVEHAILVFIHNVKEFKHILLRQWFASLHQNRPEIAVGQGHGVILQQIKMSR